MDTWSTGEPVTEQLPSDETIINIGFRATRIHMGDGQKPCYEFLAWGRASRTLPPRELQTSEYKWKELWGHYIEEIDEVDCDEYWQAVDDIESEVIEALIDDEAVCEQYASAEYQYHSAEAIIGMNHDFGYAVAVL